MKMRQRALWWGLPLLMVFLAAQIIPFFYSAWYSLLDNAFSRRYIGFENYGRMFENEYFRLAMGNTGRFVLTAVPLLTVTALLLAQCFRQARADRAVLLPVMPALIPSASIAIIFGHTFAAEGIVRFLGEGGARYASLVVVFIWKNTGLIFLALLSAMYMVPGSLYEAAELDGAGAVRRFLSITIPNIAGTIVFSVVYAVMQAFRVFKEAYLMYGAYPGDSVYMLQHYMNNHFTKLEFQAVASAGTVFTLLCLLIVSFAGIWGERPGR